VSDEATQFSDSQIQKIPDTIKYQGFSFI